MLTLGRLVVAVIGLATVALFGHLGLMDLRDWVSFALEGGPLHHLRVGSPTEAAFSLGLAIASLVGLAFLSGWRGERQLWIGAALIGVGPAAIAGPVLKNAVSYTLRASFRPEDWVAVLAWGGAAAVCAAVAISLRRAPDAHPAT